MQHKKLSSKIFYSSIVYLTLFSFLQVTLASDLSIQQDLSFYQIKLDDAHKLYYDFRISQSERAYKATIDGLLFLSATPGRNHLLSEAYSRLAVVQDAQWKIKDSRESMYQSASHEPTRALDPMQYSPRMRDEFNAAREKFLLDQKTNAVASAKMAKAKEDKTRKKSFFKSWPFFLIVGVVVTGAAAGTAVALSGGGGGGSGTGSAGGAAPAPAGSGDSGDAGTGTVTVGGF